MWSASTPSAAGKCCGSVLRPTIARRSPFGEILRMHHNYLMGCRLTSQTVFKGGFAKDQHHFQHDTYVAPTIRVYSSTSGTGRVSRDKHDRMRWQM